MIFRNLGAISIFILLLITISFSDCADPAVEIDCATVEVLISIVEIKYADCGQTNGEIMVEADGGAEPYQYSLDNQVTNSNGVFTNVKPGVHGIIATDKNGCGSNSITTYIGNKEPFQVQIVTTSSGGCNNNQGSITVTPLGGVAPYKFQLGENNDNYQAVGKWENLVSARYSVWVEDINKCFFGVYTYVPSGILYKTAIAPIITANCSTSGCHDGSIAPNLTTHSTVKANASKIKTMINDRSMPPNSTLESTDIELITCWINDGAPNN